MTCIRLNIVRVERTFLQFLLQTKSRAVNTRIRTFGSGTISPFQLEGNDIVSYCSTKITQDWTLLPHSHVTRTLHIRMCVPELNCWVTSSLRASFGGLTEVQKWSNNNGIVSIGDSININRWIDVRTPYWILVEPLTYRNVMHRPVLCPYLSLFYDFLVQRL